MTRTEIATLTDAELNNFIASMAGLETHPLCERALDEFWDRQNRAAYAERRKVRAYLPSDRGAHPMSGRVGDY